MRFMTLIGGPQDLERVSVMDGTVEPVYIVNEMLPLMDVAYGQNPKPEERVWPRRHAYDVHVHNGFIIAVYRGVL